MTVGTPMSRRSLLTGNLSGTPARTVIAIGAGCFAKQNIVCQSCADICAPHAIRFRHRVGGPPLPDVIPDLCTACGDCIPACPAAAITMTERPRGGADA
jgi:ferredoxin-type protein NapF